MCAMISLYLLIECFVCWKMLSELFKELFLLIVIVLYAAIPYIHWSDMS